MNVGDHDRQIANLAMIGVVEELDVAAARVRVSCDGMLTDWIPWSAVRAGPGVRTWSAPEVGEQVIVLSPYGDPAQGVVVGSIYQQDYPAPASVKTTHRTEYADGSFVDFDRVTSTLTVTVGKGKVIVNCATAEVHASDSATIDTPMTKVTGDLEVVGAIKAGKDIMTPADMKAGDISVKQHHHDAQGATAPTTPSKA